MKRKPLLLSLIICFITACCALAASCSIVWTDGANPNKPGGGNTEKFTDGLEYILNDTQDGYILTGIGVATDKDIIIPATFRTLPVTQIDASVFSGSLITGVTIPDSVTSIDGLAFNNCPALNSITVKESNGVYESKDNCLIEKSSKTLIAGCKASVIPTDGSVTEIAAAAFKGCTSLTGITIPQSVTKIYNGAFENCAGLETLYWNCNATVVSGAEQRILGGYTAGGLFKDCVKLKNIYIGENVTSISDNVFTDLSAAESIVIPASVQTVCAEAFSGCASLTVNCEAEDQPDGWDTNWNKSNLPVVWNYKSEN
ncbi:MAG: leucine-rich repeat domain-containing protein [Muribaculaceae bacterium]|nr:leucine-rich repeat domain-containing protein [Muribaculaceae bacterium]